MISLKNREKAYDLLKNYTGSNPYILMVYRDVITNGKIDEFGEFQMDYILKNINFEPIQINRAVNLADWYAVKKKEDWKLDFTPNKIAIKWLIGETDTTYNCYIKYRKDMEPVMAFLSKKGVLNNFLVNDYRNLAVDFDRYDTLSINKDPKKERKLREHQKDAIKFLLDRKKCILADDMGLGKSTSLAVAAIEGNFDSVLIICPASIKTTWKKELLWYVPERDISIIDSFNGKNKSELETFLGYGVGKSGKKVAELQEEAKEKGKWVDNRFVIVNYDILDEFYKIPKTWSAANIQAAYDESPMLQYIANKKSLIIIDEAHRLSNTGSQRFKIIKDLIKRGNPHSIYEATGTPITNKPMNLFNVLSFLNDPITDDYQYYAERYCNAFKIPAKGEKEKWTNIFLKNKKKQSIMQLTKPEEFDLKKFIKDNAKMMLIANGESNLDELKQRVSHIYLRRIKEDLPNIVNKTVHEVFHDLSLLEMMEYNKLWDEYEEAQLTADPEKELNKELIEGGIYRRYLSNKMVPHTIELVEDLLESGRKVVIGTCYDEELKLLQDHFGKKCVVYNGKMNAKQKDAAKDKFMEDPECKVFIGQLIAAGVGLTLTAANALVFNNISFVPGDNQQFMDRVHRLNQTEDVDIYYQIFRGTQYEKMWDIVLRKTLVIDQVIKKEEEK